MRLPNEYTRFQIVAGLIRRDDEILLVQQQSRADPAPYWCLPAGRVETSELIVEALGREIQEETGLVIDGVGTLLYIAQLIDCVEMSNVTVFAFEIADWSGVVNPSDPENVVMAAQFKSPCVATAAPGNIPRRYVSEPIVAYLRGEVPAGFLWQYRRSADGREDLVSRGLLAKMSS